MTISIPPLVLVNLIPRSPDSSALLRGLLLCFPLLVGIGLQAATLNVRNFGPTGSGSTDDTKAIQRAVRALRRGDTLAFPPGTYKISETITLKSNTTYTGSPGAILKDGGLGGNWMVQFPWNDASNTTIQGLTFDGRGMNFPGDGSAAQINVNVTKNTFRNIVNGCEVGQWCMWTRAINVETILKNSNFTYNRFSNLMFELGGSSDAAWVGGGGGIGGWCWYNVKINNNVFDHVNQGISSPEVKTPCVDGLEIANNIFTNTHRMAVELQFSGTNVSVHDNYIKGFVRGYWDSFGLSIALPNVTNVQVFNNKVYTGTTPPAGGRFGYAIEIAGHNLEAYNNDVGGDWWGGIILGGGSQNVHNNHVCGGSYANGLAGAITYEAPVNRADIIKNNTISYVCPKPPEAPDASSAGANST